MLFIFVIFSWALAAEKPNCSAKSITRNCEFFKERANQENIVLSDGTYYRNPLYKAAPVDGTQNQLSVVNPYGTMGDPQAMWNKSLRNQSEILDLLDGKGFSNEFKLAYSQNAAMMAANKEGQFKLPWPPNEKGASLKTVTPEDLSKVLKQKLGAKKYQDLNAIIARQKEPLEKQFQEQKKIYQEAMQVAQKEAENRQIASEKINRREKRIKELFEYAKAQAVQILSRGKPKEHWSDVEKAMAGKILSLKMVDTQTVAASPSCQITPENAFYQANGTISICPGGLFRSDADMISTISHEIGHAVDPCNFQMEQWSIDTDKIAAYVSSNPQISEADKIALRAIGNLGPTIHYDLKLSIDNEKFVDEMAKKGILKKTRSGFSFDQYLFKAEYSCLVKKTGFNEQTKKDAEDTVKFIRQSSALYNDKKQIEASIQRYEKALKKYPQCIGVSTHKSQMGEVMGDMLGSLVQEKYISENPFKNEEEKVGSSLLARYACMQTDEKSSGSLAPSKIDSVMERLSDEHPAFSARVDYISMTLPGLAKAYDCKKTQNGCFDHLSLTSRSKDNSRSDSNVNSQRGQQ